MKSLIDFDNNPLIPKKILSFEYYENKLPLYLRQSKTFKEHFRIWYDLYIGNNNKGLVGNSEIFLNLLMLFDNNYIEYAKSLSQDNENIQMLDYIGSLFGINRYITVTYNYDNQTKTNESLILDDEDFLTLIKSKIVKNNYDGSRTQLQELYDLISTDQNIFFDNIKDDATLNVFAAYDGNIPTIDNLNNKQKLFLSGAFNIESMGIKYNNSLTLKNLLYWDTFEGNYSSNLWDKGVWS